MIRTEDQYGYGEETFIVCDVCENPRNVFYKYEDTTYCEECLFRKFAELNNIENVYYEDDLEDEDIVAEWEDFKEECFVNDFYEISRMY